MGNQVAPRPAEAGGRIEVRPAVGRYDDFSEVVGVKKPGWCSIAPRSS